MKREIIPYWGGRDAVTDFEQEQAERTENRIGQEKWQIGQKVSKMGSAGWKQVGVF